MIRIVALLSACALVAPQDGPASPTLAKFAPAEVDLAVFAPNMPSLLRKLQAPPYQRLLRNETLREALENLFGARFLDGIKSLALVRDEAMVLFPRIDEPGFVLVCDTGLPIHPYAQVLARLFGDEWKREEEKIEGMRVARLTGRTATVYIVGAKRYLVISRGRGGLPEVLSRISTSKSGGSLAELEAFRRCVAAVGGSDLLVFAHWTRIRERSSLLKLLPGGTVGAGIGLEAEAIRCRLHLRGVGPAGLREWFREPGRFRLPPAAFEDADSILWFRPCWDRIWDQLESFTDDTEIRFAWERFKAASGIDLKKGLIDSFGAEAALVERMERDGPVLAWASLRRPIQARRAAGTIYGSIRGELRFFAEAPEEKVWGDERVYRIEKAGFAATGRGLFLGTFDAICRALDGNGSPYHALLAVAREKLPDDVVAVHLQSGRGWRRWLEDPGHWESVLPSSPIRRPKRPASAGIWEGSLKTLGPVAGGVAASVAWLCPAEDGLRGELWIFWGGE